MGREAQVMAPPVAYEPARPAHDPHQWKRASRALLRFQYHFAHLPHAMLLTGHLRAYGTYGPTGQLRDLRGTHGTYGAPTAQPTRTPRGFGEAAMFAREATAGAALSSTRFAEKV